MVDITKTRRILTEKKGMYGPINVPTDKPRIAWTWHIDFDRDNIFTKRVLIYLEFESQRRRGWGHFITGTWKSATERGITKSNEVYGDNGVWTKHKTNLWVEDTQGFFLEYFCHKAYSHKDCEFLFKHLVVYITEEEDYFDECNAACILFEMIGDKFGSVVQLLEDIGDKLEAIWVLGDQIKDFFYALGVPFTQAQEAFYNLDEWCEGVCKHVALAFNMNDLIAMLMESFPVLSHSAATIKEDVIDGLEDLFHIKETWAWISNADEWVKEKIGEGVTFTADAIADIFEDILDKVFKR